MKKRVPLPRPAGIVMTGSLLSVVTEMVEPAGGVRFIGRLADAFKGSCWSTRPEIAAPPGAGQPGPAHTPAGNSFPHFARMRSSSALLERATTGNDFFRRNGMQASMITRELRRSVSPS